MEGDPRSGRLSISIDGFHVAKVDGDGRGVSATSCLEHARRF